MAAVVMGPRVAPRVRPRTSRSVSAPASSRSQASATGRSQVRARGSARPVRLTARGRAVALVFVLGLGILASWAMAFGTVSASSGMRTLTVRPGDTLWTIAISVDPAADPRDIVRELRSLNGLTDSVLRPGQVLVLPA